MSGPERDTLIIGLSLGFAFGGVFGAWLSYRTCRLLDRVRARRASKQVTPIASPTFATSTRVVLPRDPKRDEVFKQGRRGVLRGAEGRDPRIMPIPLVKRDRNTKQHTDFQRIPIASFNRSPVELPPFGLTEDETKKLVADWRDAWPAVADFQRASLKLVTEPSTDQVLPRASAAFDADIKAAVDKVEDAVAALTGAGYKRAAAEAALDGCTLAERMGSLESWVAAALRRAQIAKHNDSKP